MAISAPELPSRVLVPVGRGPFQLLLEALLPSSPRFERHVKYHMRLWSRVRYHVVCHVVVILLPPGWGVHPCYANGLSDSPTLVP
jgi:hypothetical protein